MNNRWYTSGSDNWDIMVDIINDNGLSGEDVLRLLTDWHGTSLIDGNFMENLIEVEGY